MTNKSGNIPIHNLTKKDYQKGAILSLENAENLFDLANTCAKLNIPGNGLSILITSLEELAKSAYLKIKSTDPNKIVIRDIEKFFYKHEIKHLAIARLFTKLLTDNIKSKPKKEQEKLTLVIVSVFMILGYLKAINPNIKQNGFEYYRKRGFYVELDKDTKEWNTPMNLINNKSFDDYLNIANQLFRSVKSDLFDSNLTDACTREYIEKLLDENVYFRASYLQ
jgi:AbiV family abortive infection protein